MPSTAHHSGWIHRMTPTSWQKCWVSALWLSSLSPQAVLGSCIEYKVLAERVASLCLRCFMISLGSVLSIGLFFSFDFLKLKSGIVRKKKTILLI